MIRDRFSAAVSTILTIGVLTIYSNLLSDFMKGFGFWLSLPLIFFLAAAIFRTAQILDGFIRPKSYPDLENYDDHFPTPSVRAGDWDERLFASEESIAAAMHSAQNGLTKFFGLVRDDGANFVAEWHKDGWEVRFFRFSEVPETLAVSKDSRWADKEVPLTPAWKDIFKKEPVGRVDDRTTANLASHFMGWGVEPKTVAWCTIIHED